MPASGSVRRQDGSRFGTVAVRLPPLNAALTHGGARPTDWDLLASTVADVEGPLESRTRALALRRFLVDETPRVLPARVRGVAQRFWDRLRADAFLPAWSEVSRAASADGTLKLALRIGDATIETVLIPARGRSTVCVSSQAGCTRRCDFCATARLGAGRNLRAGEIVLQYLVAAAAAPECPPRNVVFMGMGEPLDNLDAVLAAVRALTDVLPGLSARHVTVSTAGVLPGMRRFLAASEANLALSLNATTDALRTRLMPHNARWPIAALLGLLREEGARRPGRRFFVEYVLLAGVNDGDDDARRLAGLLHGIEAQVNVIPHNPFAGSPYAAPARAATLRFQQQLTAHGAKSIVRWPRGADVAGACGQLALRQV
jgi:23S rRNA (adenine2503-C2)-methyltransferase